MKAKCRRLGKNRRMWREGKKFMRVTEFFKLFSNLGTSFKNICIHISLMTCFEGW